MRLLLSVDRTTKLVSLWDDLVSRNRGAEGEFFVELELTPEQEKALTPPTPTVKRWVGALPTRCDLCHKPLTSSFFDGRTSNGPWANMCPKCHNRQGFGIGTGKGQEYELPSGIKIGG